jgi:hypothetical protein
VSEGESSANAAAVARLIAEGLEAQGQDYALGGAIALGFWGLPRSTVDVDVTVYLPPDRPSECIWVLQEVGCEFSATEARESICENGFCRVAFSGLNVDVFLPIVPFYEAAHTRRKRVMLGEKQVLIWDAETLAVFKMMFFRRKDLADVEQILRAQGAAFDHNWVRDRLEEMYGAGDPRISQWESLVRDVK